jgi:hypothetical protein
MKAWDTTRSRQDSGSSGTCSVYDPKSYLDRLSALCSSYGYTCCSLSCTRSVTYRSWLFEPRWDQPPQIVICSTNKYGGGVRASPTAVDIVDRTARSWRYREAIVCQTTATRTFHGSASLRLKGGITERGPAKQDHLRASHI